MHRRQRVEPNEPLPRELVFQTKASARTLVIAALVAVAAFLLSWWSLAAVGLAGLLDGLLLQRRGVDIGESLRPAALWLLVIILTVCLVLTGAALLVADLYCTRLVFTLALTASEWYLYFYVRAVVRLILAIPKRRLGGLT